MSEQVVNVGLVGFGTVGTGVARLLLENGDHIAAHTGMRLNLARVVDLDIETPRAVSLPEGVLSTDLDALLQDKGIGIGIELVGGTGVAREIQLKMLRAGKDVVTANKALLAEYGGELFAVANQQARCIAFEASCAGGIPIVSALRTGLAANTIQAIYGIVNGTCNYILSKMSAEGTDFAETLAEAQEKGYAEADPSLDINGGDSAHKLAILSSIAFGQEISVSAVQITAAASSFANNGMILEPHIVKKIVSPEGRVIEEFTRKPLIDAISQDTAKAMLLMMEQATQAGGTATRAAINGVRVSAKSGTAQIFDVESGRYSEEAFVASCLAIFPTDDPRLIVYAVIEHPKAGETYGGRLAAPMIREIGEELVDYLEIPRSSDIIYEHDGTVRVRSLPKIVIGDVLPDFTGYAKRQLLQLLQDRDIRFSIQGEGWVISQKPAPGTSVVKDMLIELELE